MSIEIGDEKLECEKWLSEKLADKEYHLCDNVRAEAKERGFSIKELKAARKSVGVKTYHQFDEFGATPNWYWYLER